MRIPCETSAGAAPAPGRCRSTTVSIPLAASRFVWSHCPQAIENALSQDVSSIPIARFHRRQAPSAASGASWQREINNRSEDRTLTHRAPDRTGLQIPCAYRLHRPQHTPASPHLCRTSGPFHDANQLRKRDRIDSIADLDPASVPENHSQTGICRLHIHSRPHIHGQQAWRSSSLPYPNPILVQSRHRQTPLGAERLPTKSARLTLRYQGLYRSTATTLHSALL